MGDLFHGDIIPCQIMRVLDTIRVTWEHVYLILTKRPDRMREVIKGYCRLYGQPDKPLPNLWLGVTVENSDYLSRVSYLLDTPAVVKYVSFEPLLGNIEGLEPVMRGLDWAIAGFESGYHARPGHAHWLRGIRSACVATDTPFFFKQHGEWLHQSQLPFRRVDQGGVLYYSKRTYEWPDGSKSYRVGKKKAGHLLDGRVWHQFPEVQGE
jgi:protein gp37